MAMMQRIEGVRDAIYTHGAIHSPLLEVCPERDGQDVGRIFLKLENLQPFVRCYKLRGALNALAAHGPSPQGVVTASAGNFAQGLALACRRERVPFFVLVPETASPVKLKAITDINPNAQIAKVTGAAWWQCMLQASAKRADVPDAFRHASFISPASHPDVIDANATIGLELCRAGALRDVRELHIMVPYGGGGLVIGIARMLREVFADRPQTQVKIFACEIDSAAPLQASLEADRPVHIDYAPSFVDGIGAPSVLPESFLAVKDIIDGSLTVSLAQTAQACGHLLHTCGMVVEGAGAVALAAALKYRKPGVHTVGVVTGGNVSVETLLQNIARFR